MPEVDVSAVLPELGDELRWPLASSSHPTLEPRFAIAAALAERGVGWMELCERGIQHRQVSSMAGREQIEYLRAWCSVANHDVAGAVAHLSMLAHPVVVGLGAAIALDLADILADGCRASEAEDLLGKSTVTDPAVLDALAATYLEVDRLDDAREINSQALLGNPVEPARCYRHVREVALAPAEDRRKLADEFAKLEKNSTNTTCRQLSHKVSCWVDPALACSAYFVDQNIDQGYVDLLAVYFGWPTGGAGLKVWLSLAERAIGAMDLPGAERLAITALETAALAVHCFAPFLREIERLTQLAQSMPHDPALDPHLAALSETRASCDSGATDK